MDLKSFYKCYKGASLKKKIDMLYINAQREERMEHRADEALSRGSESYSYYLREANAMRERCRWLYQAIQQDLESIQKGNLKKVFCNPIDN